MGHVHEQHASRGRVRSPFLLATVSVSDEATPSRPRRDTVMEAQVDELRQMLQHVLAQLPVATSQAEIAEAVRILSDAMSTQQLHMDELVAAFQTWRSVQNLQMRLR
jgi:hypothetical protein